MRTLEDLIQELQSVDETHRIEAKRGSQQGSAFVASMANPPPDTHQPSPNTHQPASDTHQPSPNSHHQETDASRLLAALPKPLRRRIPAPGTKPRREVLRDLIRDLCGWQPLSARELAQALGGRDHKHLVRELLSPMVADGLLAYTIPVMENHPDQRYTLLAAETGQAQTKDQA